jgi:hypothetical protein
MGIKRTRDFILTLEDEDEVSHSESEPEPLENSKTTKKRKTDDDLNADFEFDGYGVLGGVKGFDDDGWGFNQISGVKKGAGVDLDGIIARQRGNVDEVGIENEGEESDQIESDSTDESEEDSDESEEFKGFDDDEIGMM